MRWSLLLVVLLAAFLALSTATPAEDSRRSRTGAAADSKPNKASGCRYRKGAWTNCDANSKTRTRTLTLKAGDKSTCEATKTLTKECNKACRYEKGAWGACDAQGQMTRIDRVKGNNDAGCAPTRQVTKKCSAAAQQRNRKDKGLRRNNKNRSPQ